MKKVGVVLAIFVFILSGCDWFIGPAGPDGLVPPLIFVPAENTTEALAFSDHTLVSTGYNRSIYTSTDGFNWGLINNSISENPLSWAAYGNGRFVTASTTQVFYSSDDEGANWTQAENYGDFDPNSGQSITGLAAGTGTFVAVGNTGATNPSQGFIMWSNDGNSWSDCTPTPTPSAFVSVSYTNDQFIAVTEEGSVYISTDGGKSWSSPVDIPQYEDTVKKIVYGNGLYLIVGERSLVSTPDFNAFTI